MPGIAGILSQGSPGRARARLQAMLGAMRHEPFYQVRFMEVPELGLYLGEVTFGERALTEVSAGRSGAITLALAGECFRDVPPGRLGDETRVVRELYAKHGADCFARLNGLFSGVLVDHSARQAYVFNDRYGAERIYCSEQDGELVFGSEAKALLRAVPETRRFDPEGIAQFLAVGCTFGTKSLFRGVSVLPGGSLWKLTQGSITRSHYFRTATWEELPACGEEEFHGRFEAVLKKVVPRYLAAGGTTGMSLTAGLDTRMVMACLPAGTEMVCYTFAGEKGATLDAQIAAKVAGACGFQHQMIRIGKDFFENFGETVDRTVFITDGCFGVAGAHEVYMNRQARELSAVRLTGNFGSEIFRGISTFKSIGLDAGIFSPEIKEAVDRCAFAQRTEQVHPITFAAFREVPFSLFGSMQAGRSQVVFRTPFLDNELVPLAYQVPPGLRRSRVPAFRLIARQSPVLDRIETDRGFLGSGNGMTRKFRRLFCEATFKLDYYNNEGLPDWLSGLDPILRRLNSGSGPLGLHKHLYYRSWFRRELAGFLEERFSSLGSATRAFWDQNQVQRIAREHITGRRNFVQEINAILTLDAVERLLLRGVPDQEIDLEPAMAGEASRRPKELSPCN